MSFHCDIGSVMLTVSPSVCPQGSFFYSFLPFGLVFIYISFFLTIFLKHISTFSLNPESTEIYAKCVFVCALCVHAQQFTVRSACIEYASTIPSSTWKLIMRKRIRGGGTWRQGCALSVRSLASAGIMTLQ